MRIWPIFASFNSAFFFFRIFFYFTIFSSLKPLGTLGANLLGSLLIGKGTLKTDEDAIRAGQDF